MDFELVWDIDATQGTESDRPIIYVFGDGVLSPSSEPGILETATNRRAMEKKKIQSHILAEMIKADKERALSSMKSWVIFIQLSANRQPSQPFTSLEEELPYPIIDAEEMWVLTAVRSCARYRHVKKIWL